MTNDANPGDRALGGASGAIGRTGRAGRAGRAGRTVLRETPGVARLAWGILRSRTGGPSTGGTMCVVVRDDGAVLIVKPRYRRHWCLPGGFLDAGEHPALGAAREVAEETGARLQGEPTLLVTQRRWHHVEFLFSGRLDPDGWEEPTTAWEISAVRWTSPTDMQRLHPLSVRVTALVPGGLAGIVERTLAAGPLA